MITRLNMIILMQHDLDAAITFYERLGLTKVFHLPNRWVELQHQAIKIGLCPIKQPQAAFKTGIVLEVDSLESFYNQYKEQINVQGALIEKIHGKMITIKDPGNNLIDLYEPTPEKIKDLIKQAKDADSEKKACTKADACCKKSPQA